MFTKYFNTIRSGKLIVEVFDDDNRIDKQINNATSFDLLNELELTSEYGKLFKLCLWSLSLEKNDFINLKNPPIDNAPRWQMDWFLDESIENILDEKVDWFDEGKPVAFNVPVRIKEIDGSPQICNFKVIMEKDDLLSEADSHFVRDGITITGIKKPKNKEVSKNNYIKQQQQQQAETSKNGKMSSERHSNDIKKTTTTRW